MHTFRNATAHDAQILLDLIVEHAEYERENFSREGKVEALRKCLSADPPLFNSLLVEHDGKVGGYCNYFVQFDSWALAPHMLLDALFLRPELRGQGIGTEIMNMVKAEAQKTGCTSIRWQTPVFNEIGINFYKKMNTTSGTKMFFTWDV